MKSLYNFPAVLTGFVLLSLSATTEQARPESPHDVFATNISYISADVGWTSGSDMGSHEHFVIVRLYGRGSTYVTMSPKISVQYNGTGSGQKWTYHLAGLGSDEIYKIAVLAKNKDGETKSKPAEFRTSTWPHRKITRSYAAIIVACVVAIGVCLSLIGFVVYIVYKKRKQNDVTSKSPLVQE